MANERTEREFQLDVNQAVANTESEIFGDALGDEPLDNDGDTSLEEMGEGLEGDDLEEEDGPDEETEGEGDEPAQEGAEEGEETDEEGPDGPQREAADDQRQEPPVPSYRLREEAARARNAEERAAALERRVAEQDGRLAELSAQFNARPKPVEQPTVKPDMFADPEGHERWIMERAEKRAEAIAEQRFNAFQAQQQQEREVRLNQNLQSTALGERGFQFRQAYDSLMALDPRVPANQTLVQRMINSPDQGKANLDWYEENGAEQYRANLEKEARRLGYISESRQRSQPRHETRLPESLRPQPPSLNSARGGQRQQVTDPDMMDDSDEATFRFATRR